jgi:hypothetical protein
MTMPTVLSDYLAALGAKQRPSDALSRALSDYERSQLEDPPPGIRRGLLRPQYSRLPQLRLPRVRERLDVVIPERDWMDHVRHPDYNGLRPFTWDILYQRQVGSCAPEAGTGTVMNHREKIGLPRLKLQPYMIYSVTSGGVDQGSTLHDTVAFLMKHGVCTQEVRPRSEGWRRKPSEAEYENAYRHRLLEVLDVETKEEFGTCLLLGIPVYFGYSGHAIYAVDLIDTQRFVYANSWDESWGDGGFGTLEFSRIYWGYGCYGMLSVSVPDDEVDDVPVPAG